MNATAVYRQYLSRRTHAHFFSLRTSDVTSYCRCSSSDFLTVCTLSFNSAAFCSSVAFLAIFCVRVTSHRRDSLDSDSALRWFSHSLYPLPSTPRPSWSCTCTRRGRVSVFVLLCSLGCSCLRSCKSRSSSSRPRSEHHCLAAGASGMCLDCFLRCNVRRCLALALLVRLVLVSVLCCLPDLAIILTWGNACPTRDVNPVLELCDIVYHLPVHVVLLVPVSSCEFVTFFPSCWIPLESL